MVTLVKTTLNAMSSVKKPQKTFIALLLSALIVVQGKADFRNMSWYSSMDEKRFQRGYLGAFDVFAFNCLMPGGRHKKASSLIAALDASFVTKSDKLTEGPGMFWHG